MSGLQLLFDDTPARVAKIRSTSAIINLVNDRDVIRAIPSKTTQLILTVPCGVEEILPSYLPRIPSSPLRNITYRQVS